MPWTEKDALRHTHLAKTPRLQRMWSEIANSSLDRHGDEARAIREANSVVHTEHTKSKGPKA